MQERKRQGRGVDVHDVLSSLRRLRVTTAQNEYEIQNLIAQKLEEHGIPFVKEHRLGPRNRIDFLIPGGIGIEVKQGKPNSGAVQKQVERYAAFDEVTSLVLLVQQNVATYPHAANGKPVHYVSLSKQWGISL